jgi:hypothetical protein
MDIVGPQNHKNLRLSGRFRPFRDADKALYAGPVTPNGSATGQVGAAWPAPARGSQTGQVIVTTHPRPVIRKSQGLLAHCRAQRKLARTLLSFGIITSVAVNQNAFLYRASPSGP